MHDLDAIFVRGHHEARRQECFKREREQREQ